MIELGDHVKDSISGLTGIAVSKFTYLYGCVRIEVQPKEPRDGKMAEGFVVDEQRLSIVEKLAPEISPDSTPGIPGGPYPTPIRRDPTR